MAVAQHFAVAHLAAGINRGVVFPIADHIVVPAHQGADDAHIGLKARAEGDDPFFMQKAGQSLLQLQVQLQGAVEKPGAAAAGAELFHGAHACLDDLRVGGEAQIVVGPQHDAALTLHHHLYILPGLQGPEVGIHALFLQVGGKRGGIALFKNIHMFLLFGGCFVLCQPTIG